MQRRRYSRLDLLLGNRTARNARQHPGELRLLCGRAQPRAVEGHRRGAPFRDQPRATPAPVGARGPVGQTPQPRLRGSIAYRARVQLAESKPGVHMVAHAMKPHYLSIAIPLLFAAAGASLDARAAGPLTFRSEEHTSELQSLMRTSYAVFCLK